MASYGYIALVHNMHHTMSDASKVFKCMLQKAGPLTLSNWCTLKMPSVSRPCDPTSLLKQGEMPAYLHAPAVQQYNTVQYSAVPERRRTGHRLITRCPGLPHAPNSHRNSMFSETPTNQPPSPNQPTNNQPTARSHPLEGQVTRLQPRPPQHRTQRLLARRDQVLRTACCTAVTDRTACTVVLAARHPVSCWVMC